MIRNVTARDDEGITGNLESKVRELFDKQNTHACLGNLLTPKKMVECFPLPIILKPL